MLIQFRIFTSSFRRYTNSSARWAPFTLLNLSWYDPPRTNWYKIANKIDYNVQIFIKVMLRVELWMERIFPCRKKEIFTKSNDKWLHFVNKISWIYLPKAEKQMIITTRVRLRFSWLRFDSIGYLCFFPLGFLECCLLPYSRIGLVLPSTL